MEKDQLSTILITSEQQKLKAKALKAELNDGQCTFVKQGSVEVITI